MRVQEAITQELTKSGAETQAICGSRVYWNLIPKNPTFPLVRVLKIGKRSIINGLSFVGEPSVTDVQIQALAKTQEAAADLADAITSDLSAYGDIWREIPYTSPITSGALTVKIEPTGEEDLSSDDLIELGIAAEARTFTVHTR